SLSHFLPLSFFPQHPPPTAIYPLSLHDALPISDHPHRHGAYSPRAPTDRTVLFQLLRHALHQLLDAPPHRRLTPTAWTRSLARRTLSQSLALPILSARAPASHPRGRCLCSTTPAHARRESARPRRPRAPPRPPPLGHRYARLPMPPPAWFRPRSSSHPGRDFRPGVRRRWTRSRPRIRRASSRWSARPAASFHHWNAPARSAEARLLQMYHWLTLFHWREPSRKATRSSGADTEALRRGS